MLGKLTIQQINNILSSQILGRLACTDGKHPYIVPVSYKYDGKFIYGQTNEGKKLDILRKNPNVCFEVDTVNNMRNWESAVIYGEFEELKGEEAVKARELMYDKVFSLMTKSEVHPYGHNGNDSGVDDSTRVKEVMYRVKIRRMTGRFEKQ